MSCCYVVYKFVPPSLALLRWSVTIRTITSLSRVFDSLRRVGGYESSEFRWARVNRYTKGCSWFTSTHAVVCEQVITQSTCISRNAIKTLFIQSIDKALTIKTESCFIFLTICTIRNIKKKYRRETNWKIDKDLANKSHTKYNYRKKGASCRSVDSSLWREAHQYKTMLRT